MSILGTFTKHIDMYEQDALKLALWIQRYGVNHTDFEGETPLHAAVLERRPLLVRKLLELGANPNIQSIRGETALMWAAADGHDDIVSIILEVNPNIHITNLYGMTARHLAHDESRSATVELLDKYAKSQSKPTHFEFVLNVGKELTTK